MTVHRVSSEAEFSQKTRHGKLVVVDFFATWCGPCKAIEQPLEALSTKYPKAAFLKVDVDQLSSVSAKCGVKAMPTLQVYKAGLMIREIVGADLKSLENAIRENYGGLDTFSGAGQKLGAGDRSDENLNTKTASPHSPVEGQTSILASTVGSVLSSAYAVGASAISLGTTVVSAVSSSVASTLGRASATTLTTITAPENEVPEPEKGDCEMQLRMPDGEILRRKFMSTDTIENVRQFVAGRLPTNHQFVLMNSYPRKVYEGAELQKSLKQESLSPRGQLMVVNRS